MSTPETRTSRHDVADFPSYLGVAVSYACNYRCLGCIHGNKEEMRDFLKSRQTFMPSDRFRAIVDEVARRHPPMNLTSPGETLMHPEIYDLIAYAAERGIAVEFDTNGSLVDPERLAACGARNVTFSIDGLTQEAYEAYRRGGDLELVLGKVSDLAQRVARRGSGPKIFIKYLVNAYTENTLEQAAEYFGAMPGVTFMVDFFHPPAESFLAKCANPMAVSLARWEQWRPRSLPDYDLFLPDEKRGYAVHKAALLPFRGDCYSPFKNMYINTDGEAYACCSLALVPDPATRDLSRQYGYGNVFELGVLGAFFGERAQAFRAAFRESGGRVGPCRNCWSNRVAAQQEALAVKGQGRFLTLLDWPDSGRTESERPDKDAACTSA